MSKRKNREKTACNGNLAVRPVVSYTPEQNHYRRCVYGLANVMQRRQIRGRVAHMARGARHFQVAVQLADPTATDELGKAKMAESIAIATHSKAVLIRRNYGLMLVEFELAPKFWEFYDRSSVSGLGIGLATRKEQVNIEFSDSQSQCLIAGTTGSGKTIAIQSALLAMMNLYNPQDTRFIIVDPHQDHEEFKNEAHLALPVAQDNEDIERAIRHAAKVFESRRTNNNRNDYQLVVLIDEITELVTRQPDLSPLIAMLVNGRKYKINVIAGAHQVSKADLPGKDKFTNRFVGKTEIGGSYYATGIKGLDSHKLSGMGDFYHIAHTDVTRFQVAMPQPGDFTRLERGASYTQLEPTNMEVSARLVEEETSAGRPKARIEPAILADYLSQPKMSTRQAQTLGYGRTVHNKHKSFAAKLLAELASRNLSICGGDNE